MAILRDICGTDDLHFQLTRELLDVERQHRSMARRAGLFKALEQAGLHDVPVFLGGIIPQNDVPALTSMGVKQVFGPGASIPQIVQSFRDSAEQRDPTRHEAVE